MGSRTLALNCHWIQWLWMTLNPKLGVLWIFWQFWAAKHISSELCQITTDRSRQAAYEILSIERRFQQFKSRPFRFKETCAWGHQRAVPPKSHFFLLASLPWKRLQIGMDLLPITTSPSDKLFSRIIISDFERPWTSKNNGFHFFCNFRLRLAL